MSARKPSPRAQRKPAVSSKCPLRRSLRFVNASGLIDREGKLSFGKGSFQLNDPERLHEWLEELKTYGAQGTPEGQPLWGLSRAQFAIVNEQMTKPLTVPTQGQSLPTLVKALQDDAQFPIRLHTTTTVWLNEAAHDRPITVDVTGFSTGTGLAIALNEIGTGMRPVRTPAGQIDYEILALDQLKDPWPLGWEPNPETPRNQITPPFGAAYSFVALARVFAAFPDRCSIFVATITHVCATFWRTLRSYIEAQKQACCGNKGLFQPRRHNRLGIVLPTG